ncbi:sulfatase [Marinobacterium zhoushanense]|uniref:Sulfatase n=1 Tax=Marinobacterium zhoushanense TaxID=1679163 RepID=A0ABQ1JVP4_9GAMM|nr:sulfatase-like hydrolase/transferase [Marinobacterium zhoushanense]GGB79535.1 sulfatase [Marinobacterium zhoushanense]
MSKQPNFVMIVTDQQRADWLSCMGHTVINTPNIDKLAETGLLFSEFHTASPVCMPNRASILTGRYPSVHGLRYNGCALSSRANTFVEVLREGGYKTAAIGKSHLQPFGTNTAPLAKQVAEQFNARIPQAWKDDYRDYVQEEPGRYADEEVYEFPTPYYGFDHVDMVTSHGDVCGGHYLQWLREQTERWKEYRDPQVQFDHDYTCPQAKRTKMPEALYPTRYIEERSVEWIKQQSDSDQPFFLFVSFPDPHHPFNPPGRYWDHYRPEQFELDVVPEDFDVQPLPLKFELDRLRQGQLPNSPQDAFAATDREVREAMALTGGMIDMIDDAVGSITQALQAAGLDDNTVIIFTSDHGDYLGDANLLLKGPWMRRSIHRVPFIWRDSVTGSGKTRILGSAVDVAPTVLARAGIKPYFGMQGRNLLVDYGKGEGREQLLIEHNDNVPRMGLSRASRSRTLYSTQWRITLYPGEDWGELYDFERDPRETHNRWSDPDYAQLKARLLEQLAIEVTNTMDECPVAIRRA